MKIIANVRVGKPHTKPDVPAHTSGLREGNQPGSLENQTGFRRSGNLWTATAERSTGVNPGSKNPIDPNSPNLTPP